MLSTDSHIYACPSEPNKGLVIVTPAQSNGFGGVLKGDIWCWYHGQWEDVPAEWYARQAQLWRDVIAVWRHVRPSGRTDTPMLRTSITRYAKHRGWRIPDFTDWCDVFRFINSVERDLPPESVHPRPYV